MKLHSIAGNRERVLKDFPDIIQLLSANGIDARKDDAKELFEKYGTPELYARALDALGTAP
jgi:hypothetical protein